MADNDLIRRGDALKVARDVTYGDILIDEGPDAINALPAAQPTVKPLVWEQYGGECLVAHAFGVRGFYRILGRPGDWELQYPDGAATRVEDGFDTQASAKAAAQADYEARIMSALNMQPTVSPDVAALVTLLVRAKEELRMIRMKDSGASYDVLLRTELDAALARVKGVM